jgi:hypothetical protein
LSEARARTLDLIADLSDEQMIGPPLAIVNPLRRDLERLWSEHNRAMDGTTHVESKYLEVVAIRG